MRYKKAVNLKKGEFVFSKDSEDSEISGDFVVAKVRGVKLIIEEISFIKNKTIKKEVVRDIDINEKEYYRVLNKKELVKFNKIKNKLEMLEKLK